MHVYEGLRKVMKLCSQRSSETTPNNQYKRGRRGKEGRREVGSEGGREEEMEGKTHGPSRAYTSSSNNY